MSARLPNPNMSHDEASALTLREALHHQKHTAIWSKNTDVNTFRGNIETKSGLSTLNKRVVQVDDGLQERYEEETTRGEKRNKGLIEGLGRAFNVALKPLRRLGENLQEVSFSDFADSFSSGSARINAGLKELTNGLGVMGPIINNVKTAMYKVVAVFNILGGLLQMVFGIIPKIFKRLFETRRDKDDESLSKLDSDLDALTQQRDGDKAQHTKNIEALLVKLHPDSIHALDSIVNGSGSGGSSATYFDDYRIEEEQRQYNERQAKYDEEIYELEKKRQKALARKDRMNNMFTYTKWAIMLAALVAIVVLLRDKIGSLFTGVFNELKANGYFGAIGNAASQFTSRTASLFDSLAKKLNSIRGPGNKPGGPLGASNKPGGVGGAGANTPKPTTQSPILGPNGKPIDITPTSRPPLIEVKPSTSKKITDLAEGVSKSLSKVSSYLKVGGGVLEAGVDFVLNEREYSKIKEAYELQLPVERGDGSMAPISESEMAAVDNVMINNRVGSVGRGAGAVTGGMAAGAAGAKGGGALGFVIAGPPGAVVGSAIGGLALGIGGAIVGGILGDEALTNISEYFTGTDNSQELLSGEGAVAGEALKVLEDEIIAAEEQRATANSNVLMDSSTRNFIKQEALFHSGNTDKRDTMKQNSYLLHFPIGHSYN